MRCASATSGGAAAPHLDRAAHARRRIGPDQHGRDPRADAGRSPTAFVGGEVLLDAIAEDALPADGFLRLSLPWEAAFLDGRCFFRHRRRSGRRSSPLPDFSIGAHAAVARLVSLTRDATHHRRELPALEIIAP